MKKPILIIVPSRSQGTGREKNIERFIDAWQQHTEGISDLCVALDPDDAQYYVPRNPLALYFVSNKRMRMIPTLNNCALKHMYDYEMIAFFGDDHLIRNKWEQEFYMANRKMNGYGVFYGNDLLQGEHLATAVCLDARIIRTLNFMAPPMLTHLFADNFWMDLGNVTGKLRYFKDIVFEHLHPLVGKTNQDEMYIESNSFFNEDQKLYGTYKSDGSFDSDVNKIRFMIEEANKLHNPYA